MSEGLLSQAENFSLGGAPFTSLFGLIFQTPDEACERPSDLGLLDDLDVAIGILHEIQVIYYLIPSLRCFYPLCRT